MNIYQLFLFLIFYFISEKLIFVDACLSTSPGQGPVVSSTVNPITDNPVTDAPITDAPITDAPITDAPITDAPITDAPITDAPITDSPILRACSPTDVSLGTGDNSDPQIEIDVSYINFESTRIGTTLDTTSTMQITCMGLEGYFVYMSFDQGLNPAENDVQPPPRTVTVTAECSSVDMIWNYIVTFEGEDFTIPIKSVNCDQLPN